MKRVDYRHIVILAVVLALASCNKAPSSGNPHAVERPTEPPPKNSFLADSHWVMMHANPSAQGSTQLNGPTNGPPQLAEDNIHYHFAGQGSSLIPVFSSPYADGRQVIWNGAVDRVLKQDAATGRVIDEYFFDDVAVLTQAQSDNFLDALDAAADKPEQLLQRALGYWKGFNPLRLNSFYHLIDRNNEFYVFSEPRTISVFGDSEVGKSDSDIALKRQWTLPKAIDGILFALNMTYDGVLIATTTAGYVVALERNFSSHQSIRLPVSSNQGGNIMTAFVRNAQVIDPDGGIYITAGPYLYRLQWTGEKLSNDSKDGAWMIEVPTDQVGHGSGTTPSLMGFGKQADKLVIIGDGSHHTHLLAVWRDKIPDNWQGLADQPRRVAGRLAITFGLERDSLELENSPNVAGYGVFIANVYPEHGPPKAGLNRLDYSAASGFSQKDPRYQKYGAEKIIWNPQARQLESAWVRPDLPLTDAIPAISEGSGVVYDIGVRDGYWSLEALDWNTGENLFSSKIGRSQALNPYWSPITLAAGNKVFYNGPHGTVMLDFSQN